MQREAGAVGGEHDGSRQQYRQLECGVHCGQPGGRWVEGGQAAGQRPHAVRDATGRALRASNTQDVLVARAEAKDKAGLDRLMATVNEQLERSGITAVEAAH